MGASNDKRLSRFFYCLNLIEVAESPTPDIIMPKYIIALCDPATTGKTTVINHVWDMLPSFNPTEKQILNPEKDFEIIGIVNSPEVKQHPLRRDVKIGVNSLGDTPDQVSEGLAVLVHNNCDVIVCAARSEEMLQEGIDGLPTAKFNCFLDKVFEDDPRSLKHADRNSIKRKIQDEYEVIICGHFYLKNIKRVSLTERKIMLPPFNNPMISAGNVNLSRLSAQNIVDLIERLMN